jgi:hypothetical protein
MAGLSAIKTQSDAMPSTQLTAMALIVKKYFSQMELSENNLLNLCLT